MLIEHSMNIEQSLIFNLNSKVPSIILELATFPWKFYVQKKNGLKLKETWLHAFVKFILCSNGIRLYSTPIELINVHLHKVNPQDNRKLNSFFFSQLCSVPSRRSEQLSVQKGTYMGKWYIKWCISNSIRTDKSA